MLVLGSTCDQEYRCVGSNFLHLYQLLVCSGKSELSNYVNAHCFQISIWTWFMSSETTLCRDIMTYDIYHGNPSIVCKCCSSGHESLQFINWGEPEQAPQ